MSPNRKIFVELLASGGIRLNNGRLLSQSPVPLPADFRFDKVAGMMLGIAVGDALGNTSEGQTQRVRYSQHEEIRDFLPNPYWGGDSRGYPSDDSQMAFWTLDQTLQDGGFVPERLMDMFVSRPLVGTGLTISQALIQRRAGKPWYACGVKSAGNGALMRIAPILIPHLRSPSPELWSDAGLCAMLTHNDSAALSSALAFVGLLWRLLGRRRTPPRNWWLKVVIDALRDLEVDDTYEPRAVALTGFRGTLGQFLERELTFADARNLPILDACNRWHSGAYLLETLPCALYILMRHAERSGGSNCTGRKRYLGQRHGRCGCRCGRGRPPRKGCAPAALGRGVIRHYHGK